MRHAEITRMRLEDLTPAPYNPRAISPEALAGLRASLERFGTVQPVIWNRQTGHVVGGHQRIKALQEMGDTETNVVVVDLPEIEEKALNVALNNPAIAGEFTADIHALLQELQTELPDLVAALRLDDLEQMTRRLLKDATDNGERDPDAVPAGGAAPITEPGDLWALGAHRLLCGDATSPTAYRRLLRGRPAAACFTDPPYNVDYEGGTAERLVIANDDLGADFQDFLQRAMRQIVDNTAGAIYVCMSSSNLDILQAAFRAAGGHWSTFIIWAKDRFTLGRADYQRQYEPILYGWPVTAAGKTHFWCGARDQGDVWQIDRPSRNDVHPTMKPVALVERAIRNSTLLGATVLDPFAGGGTPLQDEPADGEATVLDPFAGSGTTAIACERTGRQARLIELSPVYCDVIIRRWEEFTDRKATRIAREADWQADADPEVRA